MCPKSPFDQRHLKLFDLYAGNAPRMHAASGIAVGDGFVQHRAVRMSCDQDAVILSGPSGQGTFHLLFFRVILRGAGRIQETSRFQRFPDISNQETGRAPQDAVEEVGLVAMGQVDVPAPVCILEDCPGIEDDTGEQFSFLAGAAEVGRAGAMDESFLTFDDIVIPVQHDQPVFLIET